MAVGNGYMQYSLQLVAVREVLASIYMNPGYPDDFFTGYVEDVGPRHFLIADATPWGHLEGWRVLRTGAALQIVVDEEYERRLDGLIEHYGEKHMRFFTQPLGEEDLLYRVLDKCRREKRVISLMVGEDVIVGRVSEVNELRTRLNAMSFFGADAGVEQVSLREIDMVCIDTQEERMYETLERMKGGTQLRLLREDGQSDGAPDDV